MVSKSEVGHYSNKAQCFCYTTTGSPAQPRGSSERSNVHFSALLAAWLSRVTSSRAAEALCLLLECPTSLFLLTMGSHHGLVAGAFPDS